MVMRFARVATTLASALVGFLAWGFHWDGAIYPFALCAVSVALFACFMWGAE